MCGTVMIVIRWVKPNWCWCANTADGMCPLVTLRCTGHAAREVGRGTLRQLLDDFVWVSEWVSHILFAMTTTVTRLCVLWEVWTLANKVYTIEAVCVCQEVWSEAKERAQHTIQHSTNRWQHSNNEINLPTGVGINNWVMEEATKRLVYILWHDPKMNSTYFSSPPIHIRKLNSTECRQTPFGASSICFSCDEIIQQYSAHTSTSSSLWGKGTGNDTPSDTAPHSRRNVLPTTYDK